MKQLSITRIQRIAQKELGLLPGFPFQAVGRFILFENSEVDLMI